MLVVHIDIYNIHSHCLVCLYIYIYAITQTNCCYAVILSMDPLGAQALMRAMQIASESSSGKLKEVLEGDKSLATLPDVSQDYLGKAAPPLGPPLRKANIGLQKSALTVFQTWCLRKPEQLKLVAILYGTPSAKKKRCTFVRMVVDTSFQALWDDNRVLTDNLDLQRIGIAICGRLIDSDTRQHAETWCTKMLTANVPESMCVIVPCL